MTSPARLKDEDFAHLVRHSALVAIDIIVRCPEGAVLLGLRENEPARGTYFVPGGIIRKGETMREAFARILKDEIGIDGALDKATLLGVFEHFYAANRFNDPGYGTHYVVIAYELTLQQRPPVEGDSQHSDFKWMQEREILSAPNVHPNTRAYFQ